MQKNKEIEIKSINSKFNQNNSILMINGKEILERELYDKNRDYIDEPQTSKIFQTISLEKNKKEINLINEKKEKFEQYEFNKKMEKLNIQDTEKKEKEEDWQDMKSITRNFSFGPKNERQGEIDYEKIEEQQSLQKIKSLDKKLQDLELKLQKKQNQIPQNKFCSSSLKDFAKNVENKQFSLIPKLENDVLSQKTVKNFVLKKKNNNELFSKLWLA